MKKFAFVFPGQGSQYVGMGKELYDAYPSAREVFDQADDILGFGLRKIVFEGPDDVLRQTQYTQPAIFAASVAAFRVLSEKAGLAKEACLCAGHSLGEYSALAAAGVFGLEEGLNLVKARGEFIRAASEKNPGTMAALIGLDTEKVRSVCAEASLLGACEPVNFNCPGQTVVAGTVDAVHKAVELAQAAGATRAIVLNVSGPFHSSLMAPAAEMMKTELDKYRFSAPLMPVVTNCDAEMTTDPDALRDRLVLQIDHPVLWEQSVRLMSDNGVETFIEVGPQKVLSGLLRRIDRSRRALNVEDVKSLDKTAGELA